MEKVNEGGRERQRDLESCGGRIVVGGEEQGGLRVEQRVWVALERCHMLKVSMRYLMGAGARERDRETDRERERARARARKRERERECVCVCVRAQERERRGDGHTHVHSKALVQKAHTVVSKRSTPTRRRRRTPGARSEARETLHMYRCGRANKHKHMHRAHTYMDRVQTHTYMDTSGIQKKMCELYACVASLAIE